MKKYQSTWQYTLQNSRRAARSARRTKKNREKKLEKNRSHQGISSIQTKYKRELEDNFKSYIKVRAPENFSLIKNPEAVIAFINKLKDCFDRKQKAFVVLQNVLSMDHDALVVLLSIMVRFKAKRIPFNGDFPQDMIARNVLIQSGFFYNLNRNFVDADRYTVGVRRTHTIHTHAWKNVDSQLGAQLIKEASETIWGEARRCQGAQRTLLELMQNTNNHASANRGEKHWWISVNHQKDEGKVCFSFVDYGIGVFESLDRKTSGSKFFGAIEKMAERFKYGNRAELLKLILNGDLHKTVTGEHYRGKGLPGIAEALKRNQISNLHIITNDVFGDVANQNFKMMNQKITGTFIYWEIHYDNKNCHGTT